MNLRLSPPPRAARRPLPRGMTCLLTALCVGSALSADLTSVDDFNAGKARADAALMADKAACDKLTGNPRDVCREQARGKDRVARAELELAHTGTRKARDNVTSIKLGTAYDLARTQCNDKPGSAKTLCTRQAQAARTQGEAKLKMSQRADDAEHQRAAEQCKAMPADAHGGCPGAAKANAKAGNP